MSHRIVRLYNTVVGRERKLGHRECHSLHDLRRIDREAVAEDGRSRGGRRDQPWERGYDKAVRLRLTVTAAVIGPIIPSCRDV